MADIFDMSAAPKLVNELEELEAKLREIPLFEQFPSEVLSPLVAVSEVLNFEQNEEILAQGQLNKRLLFMISGRVSIFVDGGLVGTSEELGSLLGEISVIKRKPCTATIIADSAVQLVSVDTEALLNASAEFKSLYKSVLYATYSHVLVEKLEKTNEKAKQFEATNFKLKAKEAELKSINENLEAQSLQKMKALEGKLIELQDEVLLPLTQSNLSEPDQNRVNQGLSVIHPMIESLACGLKLKDQKILYWDSHKKNHLTTKLSLGGTGAVLEQAFTLEEALEKLSDDVYSLVILDQEFLGHLNEAQSRQPHCSYLVILNGHIQDHFAHFDGQDDNLRFFFRSEDRRTQIQNTLGAVTKILTNHYFGLEPYLGFGVEVRSERIKSSSERANLLEMLDQYLSESGVRQSYRDQARLVCEELLMNAIYDAPTSQIDKKHLYNHLPRTEAVVLEPSQQGMFSFAFDGTKILISVRDPFGSLMPKTIFKYLKNNYSSAPEEINAKEGKGGAGRGLHQIVEASSEIIFNLSPGKRTEVISIIYTEKEGAPAEHSKIQLFVE